jgi:hypothetical protein
MSKNTNDDVLSNVVLPAFLIVGGSFLGITVVFVAVHTLIFLGEAVGCQIAGGELILAKDEFERVERVCTK